MTGSDNFDPLAIVDSAVATQARVPTRLVDRNQLAGQKVEVRVIANGVLALFRVGPYDVIRGLVRAPAAWLVEARGPNGEAVLLQLTHLRNTDGNVDLLDRRRLEGRVAKATAALFVETDIPILAHGAADRDDGSRVLFWAMPWRTDAERLIASAMYVQSTSHLLRIAASLTMRLATRHVLGGFEPLLSEHLLIVRDDGADLIGVPVCVNPMWLAPDMPSPRLAPEESSDGQPTKTGDLWRLGHTLIGIAPDYDQLPEALRKLIQRLASTRASQRPPRATEVLVELEAIHASIAPHEPPLSAQEGTDTVPVSEISPEGISDLVAATLATQTRVESIRVPGGESPTLQDLSPVGDEEDTIDVGPPWAFFFRRDELDSFLDAVKDDLDRRELAHQVGTGIVQIATPDGDMFRYLGLVDLARACHRAPRGGWPNLIREDFDRLLEATARDPDVGTPVDFDIEPSPLADTSHHRHDSLDGVLKTPPPLTDLPPPEPVPIIVGRRATEEARAALPLELDGEPTEALTPVRAPPAPLIDGRGNETLGPELRAIATNRNMTRNVLAAFLVLMSLGGAAWLLRNFEAVEAVVTPTPAPSLEDLTATPANAVRIEATPVGTVVVSEADGRILGPVPLDLIIPPGRDVAVLIAAVDHEPQRLVLPVRGTISTRLTALPEGVPPCAIDLDARSVERYEGVGADLTWGNRLAVRGAAVVRARDGAGAWLVRCPSFGGGDRVELERPPPTEVQIDIDGPAGWTLFVDGADAGVIPTVLRTQDAFLRVAIERDGLRFETWIPTAHPAKFVLPTPTRAAAPEEKTRERAEAKKKRRRRRR